MQKTALHSEHLARGAKMTEFHGWDMPLYYTSILEEHACVRSAVGLFDISHMGQVWVEGPGARETLNELVVSDLANVAIGRACYTLLLNERGGIIDDIIVYRVEAQAYLVIINCANRVIDVEWMIANRRGTAMIRDISAGRSMVAVQGPRAAALLEAVAGEPIGRLGRFDLAPISTWGAQAWIARTGYTGSDGFELFVSDAAARRFWRQALEGGRAWDVQPVGLGARDTLRLEAGLRLYGTDMDTSTTPYEAGLGWTVAVNKPSFIGKASLAAQQARGIARQLVGFELGEGPVPRHGFALTADGRAVGTVTSGTFSPTLNKPIGMASVESAFAVPGTPLQVAIRAKTYVVTVVKMPFWRKEKPDAHSQRVAIHENA